MSELGIGRVPADVDATSEAVANVEAADLMARHIKRIDRPPIRCSRCRRLTRHAMNGNLGVLCPECYEDQE